MDEIKDIKPRKRRKTKSEEELRQIAAAQGQRQADASAADPSLTAPFEGVSIEDWARAAQVHTRGLDTDRLNTELAGMGLDRARFERINAHFEARMQGDTTGVISSIFAAAFTDAQAPRGAFGLERYAEIMGALQAWSADGEDVDGKLQEVFGLNTAEYAKLSQAFSEAMIQDPSILTQLTEKQEKYRLKYALPDPDADLDL